MGMSHYFVSDLHLFARRSQADKYMSQMEAAAEEAGFFVLGGDIFDFKWSTLPSFDATVEAAIQWLDRLVERCPRTQFHFLLGNHDSHPRFVERLSEWAKGQPRFEWHHEYLRLGNAIFLHGDVVDRPMTTQQLLAHRQRASHRKRIRSRGMHQLYDLAITARLHVMAAWAVHRKDRVADRILYYLNSIGEGPESGVSQVFFGHTHVPLRAYQYGGLTFQNGGAPMRGIPFAILPFELPHGV